jgi:Domain of unknown function (DUF4265)
VTDRFVEHPNKCVVWRGEVLETYPDAVDADTTVWCFTGEEESGATLWEGLVAHRISDDSARIAAVPVFTYELSLGDEVFVVVGDDARIEAVGIRDDSDNYTFRITISDDRATDVTAGVGVDSLVTDLRRFPCVFDVFSHELLSVSVSWEDVDELMVFLDEGAASGRFAYEQANP